MKLYYIKPAFAFLIILSSIFLCEMFAEPHGKVTLDLEYLAFNYIPVILLWLLIFALTNKSIFSSILSSLIVLGFVAVNNIKFDALAKPLMPSDFLLAGYVLKTPGLFLHYLNTMSLLCVAAGVAVAVAIYKLEKQQLARTRYAMLTRLFAAAAALAFFTGITSAESVVAKTYSGNSLKYFSWDPANSAAESGIFNTFIRLSEGLDFSIPAHYGDASTIERLVAPPLAAPGRPIQSGRLPDIIVVQSESFYDLRQHELEIGKAAYASYDNIAGKAAVSGNLTVPTIGGNTVKTEFSFLSGIESTILPAGCEFPYRSLVRKNIWSIAWYLKSLGYSTIAIHPYHRTFWDRNIAYPFLGFDRFIDHTHFSKQMREGFFVSDRALADKIAAVRKEGSGPMFVFAVTMENHGPWDKVRVPNHRKLNVVGNLTPEDRTQVGRYLHHVVNAGDMASGLARQLERSGRPTVLAFYGDHAPGLGATKVPMKPAGSLSRTPYFIWKNFGRTGHTTRDTSVSFLASEILDQAGINNDVYFRANSYIDNASGGTFDAVDQGQEVNRSYTQLLYNNLLGKVAKARSEGPVQSAIPAFAVERARSHL